MGRRIGDLGIPVYLYEHAATSPSRSNLAAVRAGEYEGLASRLAQPEWRPDFGPARHNPLSGAYIIGAREFLIAYNVNLATTDKRYADDIAYTLRDRKLGHLSELKPAVIASANIGCITHLQSGTGTPVRHWVEVLDEALTA